MRRWEAWVGVEKTKKVITVIADQSGNTDHVSLREGGCGNDTESETQISPCYGVLPASFPITNMQDKTLVRRCLLSLP